MKTGLLPWRGWQTSWGREFTKHLRWLFPSGDSPGGTTQSCRTLCGVERNFWPKIFDASCVVCWASLVAQLVKNPPTVQETPVQSLGWEDPLEKGMAIHSSQCSWASLVTHMVKNLPAMWETWVLSLGWEDPLEEGMATHSSILAWKIPWTEEPGRLQSTRSPRVGHD